MIWQVIFLRCGCASHVRCIASGSIFAKPNCRAWCQHGTIVSTLLTRSETFVTRFDLYCCVLLVWEAAPSPNGCRDVGSEIVKRIRFSHLVTHAVTWQRQRGATCDIFSGPWDHGLRRGNTGPLGEYCPQVLLQRVLYFVSCLLMVFRSVGNILCAQIHASANLQAGPCCAVVRVCFCKHEGCHLQFPLCGAWRFSAESQARQDNNGQSRQNSYWVVHWCKFSCTRESCHLMA